MEYSSPLAAMHPPPLPVWASRKDVPVSRSMYNGYQAYGANSFDFKSMSMHTAPRPAKHDYFNSKTVRGSSPTASLTADLDANFHIDKSPQAPTPRRSLFTADLIRPRDDAGRLMTPPIEVEPTTPPVCSSSPAVDAMDVSPLPHKALFYHVTLPSPTPETTPALVEDISPDLLSPPEQPVPHSFALQPPISLAVPERRRPVTRPSLFRAKALSSTDIPRKAIPAATQLPSFRFGDVSTSGLSCSSTPSLIESSSHPAVDSIPAPAPQVMGPPPRRPSMGASGRSMSGSPSMSHVRKSSTGRPPFVRPARKLMRRSLSMFQHPDDVMKEEQQDAFEPQPCLAAATNVDEQRLPRLPHFVPDDEPDSLPRISQETMVDILEAKYSGDYDRILVIDCRFEYEYQGGHIEGAVNFNDKQQLAQELLETPPTSSTLLVFHCEYSIHRAPLMAKFIRNHDRTVNAARYPHLSYPDMYILDGGYSKFFHSHRSKCFPQSYVEMNDERHELACERGMAKVKQQRQKLFRHQTFAFGDTLQQHDERMDGSPTTLGSGTARSALGPRSSSAFTVGEDIAAGIGMAFARRMASY